MKKFIEQHMMMIGFILCEAISFGIAFLLPGNFGWIKGIIAFFVPIVIFFDYCFFCCNLFCYKNRRKD